MAEDILENGEDGNISDHFLGAIVCDQMAVFGRDVKAVSVIDGQQRLTTLALVLAAIYEVCGERGFDDDREYLIFVEEILTHPLRPFTWEACRPHLAEH